jgi:hypothetical protein
MRWQRRLKSYFSEDQALFLEIGTRHGSRFSASIFRRTTNQPAIHNRIACVEWKEILLMSAQRFGKLQECNAMLQQHASRRPEFGEPQAGMHGAEAPKIAFIAPIGRVRISAKAVC